jgi:hypothetical protein
MKIFAEIETIENLPLTLKKHKILTQINAPIKKDQLRTFSPTIIN